LDQIIEQINKSKIFVLIRYSGKQKKRTSEQMLFHIAKFSKFRDDDKMSCVSNVKVIIRINVTLFPHSFSENKGGINNGGI
jgi:hypothetical protein